MDIGDIMENSFKYPLSDFKKFLILGIPYLVIAIFASLFILQVAGLSSLADVSEDALLSSPLLSTFLVTTLLFIVVAVICSIIMSGIGISVIRETIKPSDMIPDLEPVNNFVDGIQSLIISIVYMIIPVLAFVIIVSVIASLFGDNAGWIVLILFLLFFIAIIFIGLLLSVAICRFAETGSITQALDVTKVYEIGKEIGYGKIFGVILLINIIFAVISMIGNFISMIPIIGTIIVIYFLYTYIELVTYRAYGLLYRDRTQANTQNAFQQPYTPIADNQNQQPVTENNDFKSIENTENLDFQTDNSQNTENEESNEATEAVLKKCTKCGYSNPDYVNICVNCGNEL